MNQQRVPLSTPLRLESPGQRLRQQRLKLGLTQEALAEALGVSARSISRWEQDQAIPQEVVRQRLRTLFGMDPQFLPAVVSENGEATLADKLSLWHVPLRRNPFFTGREELLQILHERLKSGQHLALTQSWAISGLGGIGKTQIALEYAYRHARDYAAVFWINAATQETLQDSLVTIAECLHLPAKNEHDHKQVILAVKQWLVSHQNWLLILDNADEVTLVQDLLPAEQSGHLLLTTRAQVLGPIAQRMEIDTMGLAEGTLFLLRRARVLDPGAFLDHASPEQLAAAEAIVIEMDFLPLALDQSGAYIEEVGCSLQAYLELYRTHHAELLRRRGQMPGDYPASVATTWSLNFQQVEQANPAAAELLRLCAFLEPDTIPEEIFSEGGTVLGPVLEPLARDTFALNGAIEELRKFSLTQRNAEARLLRLHRLVQAVLKDAMNLEERRQWAERAVRATSLVFPGTVGLATWSHCQRFLPQAQTCSGLIQGFALVCAEAATLLQRTANYLCEAALYEQVEPLYRRSLRIWEQLHGPEHPAAACSLNGLATLFYELGKHEQAEELFQQALRIQEQAQQFEHPEMARTLNELAFLYQLQGKPMQAEPLFQQALRIREQVLGPEHLEVAGSLSDLGYLYMLQGKYEQAKLLHQRALRIREQVLGPEHPAVAGSLMNLAELYRAQGRYEQAEPLYQRALRIREPALGPEHPRIAGILNNLAELYRAQRRYEQAEPLYQRSLRIWERAFGLENPDIAVGLTNLAELYRAQERYEQAEPLYQRALRFYEQTVGTEHPDVALPLQGLAHLAAKQGKDQQAESLYRRALVIREQTLGGHHIETAEILHDFAAFQETRSNCQEAVMLYQRALAIREQVLGAEHSTTAKTRTAYLLLLQTMGQEGKANYGGEIQPEEEPRTKR